MCTVVRGDLPVNIRWSKDGRPIESAPVESTVGGAGFVSGNAMQAINEQQQQQQHQTSIAEQTTALNNNNPNSNSNLAGIAIKHLDPYSSTLTFASLQSHHRGVYTCDATNEAGRANQSSSLVIHGEFQARNSISPKLLVSVFTAKLDNTAFKHKHGHIQI